MPITSKGFAIIGMGYWGQIIYKNLKELVQHDITTYDEFKPSASSVGSLDEIDADHIFVCVTASEHYRICEYFLQKENVKIFCEKPLTNDLAKSKCLFSLAKESKNYLFVDWLFTYNNEVLYIKDQFFDQKILGEVLNINMNRLNKGPERYDTNAIYDLASHDISILHHWFGEMANKVNWVSYKRNRKSIQDDSCIGILDFGGAIAQVNCSWEHNIKDRYCILDFEKGIVCWDDIKKTIIVNDIDNTRVLIKSSPIQNAIAAFYNGTFSQEKIRRQTLAIEETLNDTRLSIR